MKNLTPSQLLFHYAEIKVRRQEESEVEQEKNKKIVKDINAILEVITNTIYIAAYNAAMYSRTDLKFDSVKEIIHNFFNRLKGNKNQRQEKSMEEEYMELSKVVPTELTVDISDWADSSNLHVKRVKRGERGGRRKRK